MGQKILMKDTHALLRSLPTMNIVLEAQIDKWPLLLAAPNGFSTSI